MSKRFVVPAFIELRGTPDEPESCFVTLERLLLSPALQQRVLDKRKFGRIVRKLRETGHLTEIPYIGPKARGIPAGRRNTTSF